jgi:hypothetical protein
LYYCYQYILIAVNYVKIQQCEINRHIKHLTLESGGTIAAYLIQI